MTTQNNGWKIATRSAVLLPFALWHAIAAILWYRSEKQRCEYRLCYEDLSYWSLWSDAEAWIKFHFFGFVLLLIVGVSVIVAASLGYWIITGKNLFRGDAVQSATPKDDATSEESEESDDFVPCTNPNCPCPSHSTERFVTEWQAKD